MIIETGKTYRVDYGSEKSFFILVSSTYDDIVVGTITEGEVFHISKKTLGPGDKIQVNQRLCTFTPIPF